MTPTPFSRLTVSDPEVQKITSDIYDKLQQIQTLAITTQTVASAAATLTQVAQAISSAAGGSTPSSATITTILQVSPLPGNNPASTPLAVDGALVEFAPTASTSGTLYRFSTSNLNWNGPILGGILSDTFANFANYSPADYPGVFFLQSDRLVIYFSTGSAWTYATGVFESGIASLPGSLGTTDAGYLFFATDRGIVYRWTGTAWIYFTGIYEDVTANRPAALTTNDTNYLFIDTTLKQLERWTGSTWDTIGATTGVVSINGLSGVLTTTVTSPSTGYVLSLVSAGTTLAFTLTGPGAWLTWSPTVTGGATSVVINSARYLAEGKKYTIELELTYTTSGPSATQVNVSLPLGIGTFGSNPYPLAGSVVQGGAAIPISAVAAGTVIVISPSFFSGASSGTVVAIGGSYETT